MIEDLYRKDQKVVYKSGNELPTQGGEVKESVKSIYENAEWKLKPSKRCLSHLDRSIYRKYRSNNRACRVVSPYRSNVRY